MNQLQVFSFEGKTVRTQVDAEGNPLWVAKDVCEVLGISKTRDAVARLRGSVTRPVIVDGVEMTALAEPGLYQLIMKSKKPEAARFQDWVTNEVLPSIRKNGIYSLKPLSTSRQLLLSAQALVELEERQTKQEARLIEIESRVLGSHNGQPLSALGYLRTRNFPSDMSTVTRFGRRAAKLARELGVASFDVPDARFGRVNGFYADFYDQVANDFFGAIKEIAQ